MPNAPCPLQLRPVLIIGGTHGNERTGPWIIGRCKADPLLLGPAAPPVDHVIGNPAAVARNRRYLERDLNRCFTPELLEDPTDSSVEVRRARTLLEQLGPAGAEPHQLVIDLHTTTASMGACLVLGGRRPTDLALAACAQEQCGLPIYIYESDPCETGFLVNGWPCAVTIEVGPVAQGIVDPLVAEQTLETLRVVLACATSIANGSRKAPERVLVHGHITGLDLPKDAQGNPIASIHPERARRDWQAIGPGAPLFLGADDVVYRYSGAEVMYPVFINEAAYGEKGIAMNLARRETLTIQPEWLDAVRKLMLQGA